MLEITFMSNFLVLPVLCFVKQEMLVFRTDSISSVNYFDKFVVHTDIFDSWISPTLRDREEFKFANVCLGWSNLVI